MLASVLAATLNGLDGRPVRVEVDVAPGLPGFTIVGLPDAALQESRERVRGAIRNCGYEYPPRRLTVNLAPADVRKSGSSLDLAIAVGILIGSEQLKAQARWALLGELSLGGELRPIPGLLPMVAALARRGVARVIVPAAGLAEARLAGCIEVEAAATLADAATLLRESRRGRPRTSARRVELLPAMSDDSALDPRVDDATVPDLVEVRGQLEARRAVEIALSGGHGLVMIGPPGCGKTLLARTVPSLLPPLTDGEARTATIIASVAGSPVRGLIRGRPFRAPHHTISYAGMVGGGPHMSPGEITLANDGILFLDELPEFDRPTLEALRQPLEDGHVLIARAGRAAVYPSRFQLIAAMNPCPCGYAGTQDGRCRCPQPRVERYAARVSGPLRDRIDLWVQMPPVTPGEYVGSNQPEDSDTVRGRVLAARQRQLESRGRLNSRLAGRALRTACGLGPAEQGHAARLSEVEGWSARGMERLLRVARTIADLDGSGPVSRRHLDEAARFRSPGSAFGDEVAV